MHKELVEKIGQMSVLRESNATLRADREAGTRRVKELEGRVEEMSREIEPLREEVRGLKAEVEAMGGHVRRLEEESARWQARNLQLLAKVRSSFKLVILGLMLLDSTSASILRNYRLFATSSLRLSPSSRRSPRLSLP